MLADIERMEIFAQCHEYVTVLGVILGDQEPEHVAGGSSAVSTEARSRK